MNDSLYDEDNFESIYQEYCGCSGCDCAEFLEDKTPDNYEIYLSSHQRYFDFEFDSENDGEYRELLLSISDVSEGALLATDIVVQFNTENEDSLVALDSLIEKLQEARSWLRGA